MQKGFAHTMLLIIAGGLIIILGAAAAVAFFRAGNEYETAAVVRGSIIEEVSANGTVESPDAIELGFKNSGALAALPVAVGDAVSEGDLLAQQNDAELSAQRAQYDAAIAIRKAERSQLLAGASAEEIALAGVAVENAETVLRSALTTAFTLADGAVRNYADRFFKHAESDPSFGIEFTSGNTTYAIKASSAQVQAALNTGRKNASDILNAWPAAGEIPAAQLDAVAQESEQNLRSISAMLDAIARIINEKISDDTDEAAVYEDFKTDIETARSNISTALTTLSGARADLLAARSNLEKVRAPVRQEDIAVHEAQISEAQAAREQVLSQLSQLTLYAPASGTVAKVNGRVGELVGPETAVVTLMPERALQVSLNVSETVIANVAPGQTAHITLDAFAGSTWQGTVTRIEPSGTVIGGAVYYETTVILDAPDPRIRPGMTATAWIQTAAKDAALIVPASAIRRNDDGVYVEVLDEDEVTRRPVITGIADANGMVEIVSGLSEGDMVVLDVGE